MKENSVPRILQDVKDIAESGRMPKGPNNWELSGQNKFRYNLGVCGEVLKDLTLRTVMRIDGQVHTLYKRIFHM